MSTHANKHGKGLLAATSVAAMALLAALAIGPMAHALADDAASSEAAEAAVAADESATADATDQGEMLSLDEYAELYPLQTQGWLTQRADGTQSMGAMEEHFNAVLDMAFGINGVPLYCGSCHNADYKALLAERGPEAMLMTDKDAGIEVEYMGCGVCHTADLEAGVTANTSFWPTFISEESWNTYIDQDDAVCGQCHMLEPGSVYMLPDYAGTVDIYEYGVSADAVLQAQLEAWDEHPIELTQVMFDNGFQVGASRIDPETGALIIGDNNKPILEMFQGSKHQMMGLTCTDCHMPQVTAEDGTVYTEHYACDPLENQASLEFCLTCHKAQGIESPEAMVEFVEGLQAELAEAQQALHADVNTLHDLLVEAVASGDVDAETLEAAQDAYTRGLFYYQFQAQLTSGKADQGVTVAHNRDGVYEVIDKAEAVLQPAIESLQK